MTKDVEGEDSSCQGEINEIYNREQDYEIDETYDPDAEYPEQNKPIKETKYHYCWIKNLNRLLYDQNNHKGKNHTSAKAACMASRTKTYSTNTEKTVMALIKIQQ